MQVPTARRRPIKKKINKAFYVPLLLLDVQQLHKQQHKRKGQVKSKTTRPTAKEAINKMRLVRLLLI